MYLGGSCIDVFILHACIDFDILISYKLIRCVDRRLYIHLKRVRHLNSLNLKKNLYKNHNISILTLAEVQEKVTFL